MPVLSIIQWEWESNNCLFKLYKYLLEKPYWNISFADSGGSVANLIGERSTIVIYDS